MNEISRTVSGPSGVPAPEMSEALLPTITSRELLRGERELIIQHEQSVYRLKLTGSNKLILTK